MSVASQIRAASDRTAARGVPVVYVPGWETRGHGRMTSVTAELIHHTATPEARGGDYPSLAIVRDGRSDLPGPLSQFGTGRGGTIYVIASGISYHSGNTFHARHHNRTALGNEMEGAGGTIPFRPEQLDAAAIHAAELRREFGYPLGDVVAHAEAAKPRGRKIDPRPLDMGWFRASVEDAFQNPGRRWIGAGGAAPAPAPAPSPVRPGSPAPAFPLPAGYYFGPKSGPRESVSGFYSHREDFRRWQNRMRERGWNIVADGLYGPASADVIRKFQSEKRLGVDALVGPVTWAAAWTAPIS